MKYLLIIILSSSTLTVNAQMSGIPEQDSLLELKDMLFLKCGEGNIQYQWTLYQWLQWVKGNRKKMCIYECDDVMDGNLHIYKCPHPDEQIINCSVQDTSIKIPQPISWEGFMSWQIKTYILKE